MIKTNKYKKLSIHEKINIKNELKIKQQRYYNIYNTAFDIAEMFLNYMKNHANKQNNKNVYQLIK